MIKKITILLLIFILLINITTCYGYISLPIWNDTINTNSENTNYLNLESESAILIETTTGEILYEKN